MSILVKHCINVIKITYTYAQTFFAGFVAFLNIPSSIQNISPLQLLLQINRHIKQILI